MALTGSVMLCRCMYRVHIKPTVFMEVDKQATLIHFNTALVYVNSIGYFQVLYGCETWSLTLREERRLRVFEIRVLGGIFGAERDGVTGEWRKLHNEELNDLYCSPHVVRVVKCLGLGGTR